MWAGGRWVVISGLTGCVLVVLILGSKKYSNILNSINFANVPLLFWANCFSGGTSIKIFLGVLKWGGQEKMLGKKWKNVLQLYINLIFLPFLCWNCHIWSDFHTFVIIFGGVFAPIPPWHCHWTLSQYIALHCFLVMSVDDATLLHSSNENHLWYLRTM